MTLVRFRYLQEQGIVNDRMALARAIDYYGFRRPVFVGIASRHAAAVLSNAMQAAAALAISALFISVSFSPLAVSAGPRRRYPRQ